MEQENCRELLFDALQDLVFETTIDKISVKDIVNIAGVSRSSFYRYCYDKYELLNKYYNCVLNRTLYRFNQDLSWNEALESIYSEIKYNLPFYQNALESNQMNCLKNHILNISNNFHFSILKNNGVDMKDWKNVRTMQSSIFGNLEIMTLWIKEGMHEPIPEMIEVMNDHVPSQFSHFFS